jgi:2-polyprenyl-3-methyl-5-hydroxy-6-metoxy-1,4-benzoquinol methylase
MSSLDYNEDYYAGKTSNYGNLRGYGSLFYQIFNVWRCSGLLHLITKHKSGSKLLDVGCAFGLTTRYFHEHGFKCVGVDISDYAISQAKKRNSKVPMIQFDCCDIQNGLHFPNEEFDVILALDILEHVQEVSFALAELKRVLAHDGIIVVSVPFKINASKDKDLSHCQLLSYSQWMVLLDSAGFDVIDILQHPLIYGYIRSDWLPLYMLCVKKEST